MQHILLTVDNSDEQQIAMSPSILEIMRVIESEDAVKILANPPKVAGLTGAIHNCKTSFLPKAEKDKHGNQMNNKLAMMVDSKGGFHASLVSASLTAAHCPNCISNIP